MFLQQTISKISRFSRRLLNECKSYSDPCISTRPTEVLGSTLQSEGRLIAPTLMDMQRILSPQDGGLARSAKLLRAREYISTNSSRKARGRTLASIRK